MAPGGSTVAEVARLVELCTVDVVPLKPTWNEQLCRGLDPFENARRNRVSFEQILCAGAWHCASRASTRWRGISVTGRLFVGGARCMTGPTGSAIQ